MSLNEDLGEALINTEGILTLAKHRGSVSFGENSPCTQPNPASGWGVERGGQGGKTKRKPVANR